ncbi:MAG: hypothetical protein K2W95_20170 [Candidatus Obscuribacterales bacterium]|nr:hypothetical protein [Candidatus Obscuribacterales bacterium]
MSQLLRPKRSDVLAWTGTALAIAIALIASSASIADPDDKDTPSKSSPAKNAAGTAKSPAEPFSRPYGSHLQAILDTVSATPEQRSSITAVVEAFRPKIDPLRQTYNQKRQEFLTGITTGLSSDQIMVKQTDLSQLYSDISCQYCRMSLEIRRQLRPEQIVQYESYRMKQGWGRKKQ